MEARGLVGTEFGLDLHNQILVQGSRRLPLRPKTFEVLRHLVKHTRQLVTKTELLDVVWADRFVGDNVLKVSIRELRKALGDNPKTPRFIETHHRRGYRFIGNIKMVGGPRRPAPPRPPEPPEQLIGRYVELSRLRASLRRARAGEHQIVLITGEQGIGKSTLIDAFIGQATRNALLRIARGQCQEVHGQSEAYMPILEALERLCHEPGNEELIPWLERHAPSWLTQMPSLVDDGDHHPADPRAVPAGRMLRELGMALEALGSEKLLVMVLEDLQWADASTLDLVSALVRRRQASPLLLLASSRHPLPPIKDDPRLAGDRYPRSHPHCIHLALRGWTPKQLADHLEQRLGQGWANANRVERMLRLTRGNPLLVELLIDELCERGDLAPEEDARCPSLARTFERRHPRGTETPNLSLTSL